MAKGATIPNAPGNGKALGVGVGSGFRVQDSVSIFPFLDYFRRTALWCGGEVFTFCR